MVLNRRSRLHVFQVLSFAALTGLLHGAPQQPAQPANSGQQNPPAQNTQQQPPQQQQPQQQQQPKPQPPPQPKNPFENVPVEQQPPAQPPPQPKLEQPPAVPVQPPAPTQRQTVPGAPPENYIEEIQFRGSRRVPQDTMRALIYSKKGDKFDEDTLRRDFMALWNTGKFDDIRLEREQGQFGWIIRFVVVERPVVRTIKYEGNKSISVSEILDRFKERKVGLSVEQQYDQNKVQRARVVLQEYEAERGHQYATVTAEVHRVPPSSLEIVFKIDEGAKVKVGNIAIVGNKSFNQQEVIRAMHNLKPIGIPYSILFENMFARTFDSSKLEEDKSRIQDFYQQHGYFVARATDSSVKVYDIPPGTGVNIPLIHSTKGGKKADISVTVEEGLKYRLHAITFTGVHFFRTPEALMRPLFGMSQGDIFSTAKLRKGIENMRKLYGEFGFIDFVAEPGFEPDTKNGTIDMSLSVDEGKQFFVRRIDFSGNITTRDKVIRRQLLIDEGDMFNSRLWDVSILRLNQLGYFEPLKEGEATDITRDTKTDTVDLKLKLKERGKNSIQLNGGVSGISGSFIGFTYSTNNFLGLGETLSLTSQLGTRLRSVQLGFTEPYLLDKPIQTGFTVYTQRFDYNQAREASILSGQNLIPLYNQLGSQNLLNYVSNGYGGTVFMQYPLRRSFARIGLTYGYDISHITTLTDAASAYFNYLDFQANVGGPNSLSGIRTSKFTPSYSFNTVNHPITPTGGTSFFVSGAVAGIGGNVNTLEPTIDYKHFRPGLKKGHVIGYHVLARMITGYGGKVAPPFSRYYIGGENDIRGFDIWGISPIGFIPSTANVNVLNGDGSIRQQRTIDPTTGVVSFQNVTQTIPIYQLVFPGGDTNVTGNFEYRIPIVGPVTLAIFADAGVDKLSWANQLKLDPSRITQLNTEFPQAGFKGNVVIAPGTQKVRSSTGLELQVLMPVVNAPFRVYWAFNPTIVRENLQPPIVADRSLFPNIQTFNEAVQIYGTPVPFFERHSTFRFSIGRTF